VLENLLNAGYLPVVCTLAADANGQILNVNADTVGARIAVALQAAKYFSVTEVDGVLDKLDDPTTLHSYLDIEELETMIASGSIGGGMLPKLAACMDALRGGVQRVHVINGLVPDTILSEVFTNEGCGTLIVAERDPVKAGCLTTQTLGLASAPRATAAVSGAARTGGGGH
jgi:acetylglutamate kinase